MAESLTVPTTWRSIGHSAGDLPPAVPIYPGLRTPRVVFDGLIAGAMGALRRSVNRAGGRSQRTIHPDVPSSLNTGWRPAFLNVASCQAGFWSSVETRA
jgi:hypothetical protein